MENNNNYQLYKAKKREILKVLPKDKETGMLDLDAIQTLAYYQLVGNGFNLNDTNKLPPCAVELEQAVLGAVMMDSAAFQTVQNVFGRENPFYTELHQAIWKHMVAIGEQYRPIDRLSLWETLQADAAYTRYENSPYYLVELCQTVTSSANVEYHANTLMRQYTARQLINICISSVSQLYDKSNSPLMIREQLLMKIENTASGSKMLETVNGTDFMARVVQAESARMVCGPLLKERSITMLFAAAKVGKSLLSIMIADSISKGVGLFNDTLKCETGPQTVLYFDFELYLSDWKSRYTDNGADPYEFCGNNFFRVGEKQDFTDYASFAQYILGEIRVQVTKYKPHTIVVDNLTYMTDGSIKPEVATNIMKFLKMLNKTHGLTVLVLTHTPKIVDRKALLTEANMGGSSQLINFCTDIVGLSHSDKEPDTIYMKHLISRGSRVEFGEKKTIWLKIEKPHNFLGMTFLGLVEEREHKMSVDDAMVEEDLVREAFELQKDGKSLRDIHKQLKLPFSSTSLHRKLIEFSKKKNTDASDGEGDWLASLRSAQQNTIGRENSVIYPNAQGDFESGERDREFKDLKDFEQTTRSYFEIVKSVARYDAKLEFIYKGEFLARAFMNRDIIQVNTTLYFNRISTGDLWSGYLHEKEIQQRRGIKKQYRIMWTLCHEMIHLLHPSQSHGKQFAELVEALYNKVMLALKK